jgi:dihydrolipoamide dehydrogenase
VPVRTLAHAARLLRDVRQLDRYGITVSEPVLDYPRLLARVDAVRDAVRRHSAIRRQIDALGATVYERAGTARFAEPYTIETRSGLRLAAGRVIVCTGGVSRRLSVPGVELTATHSDAWGLTSVPPSMLVIGAGATGVQVASIFSAFGARVHLFESGPRILRTEDEDVSAVVAAAFRDAGIAVHERFGTIEAFERAPTGVRMVFSTDGTRRTAEAALAVVAIGWTANTAELSLATPGVKTDHRGFVIVDAYQRTSAAHVLAAGDVTGRLLLVPEAIQEGFVAGTNAVRGATVTLDDHVSPVGSFTDPEYARVGVTETAARQSHDVVTAVAHFDSTTRTIIDGRTIGFCKVICDRASRRILGCHVVGERAVEIAQLAAVASATGMRVDDLARIPLSFPTYAGVLGRVAASAARQLNVAVGWQAHQVEVE